VRRFLALAAVALAFAAAAAHPASAAAPAAPAGCRADVFEEARYTVCTFSLKTSDVRVFWAPAGGTPYRTFPALAAALAPTGQTLAFAINGGMYREDWSAVGLLVENGVERHALNRSAAAASVRPVPNFYKLPNGVFYIARGKAAVVTADRYFKDKPKPEFATQSGPMLVIDGKLHPGFRAASTELTIRSGVGVVGDTTVVFALSEDAVNFDEFARLFRDRLGAKNALFLDGGTAPGIYAPELGRNDPPGHGGYGPIIAVVRKGP
jgi:uncharacterized protein YigE (DUF2233 family)